MGISDKDYADAIQRRRAQQLAVALTEKEKQMLGAMVSVTNPTDITNMGPSWTAQAHMQQQTIGIKALREEELSHEAMQAPLSSLADMWLARWGGKWVAEQEFMDDDFWRLTLIRLVGANKLERHTFVNQYHCVYRIIE